MRGWGAGALILAVTLLSPNVAIAGLVAVLAAYGFARLIRLDRSFLRSGFYTYNPLLVGLSIGYLFKLTTLTLFFVVTAGVAAFLLTHMLYSMFSYYFRLPVLSLPFVIMSTVAYLAAVRYSNLYVSGLYPRFVSDFDLPLPVWLSGFLQALGAVFFVPNVLAGFAFALILLFSSRILLFLAVSGYYVGTLLLAWLGGSAVQAFADLNAFNFILVAMAIGGVFLIPSRHSYGMALMAVAVSTVLLSSAETVVAQYGLPVFALPFNVTSLTFLYVLGLVQYPYIAPRIGRTPEASLDEYLTERLRYPGSLRTLRLPFAGRWTVWQGFDGQWTHQGSWKHAYDFVMSDAEGNTYEGNGDRLDQYTCFRKPVLSPVRGRVVRVVDHLPDNPIGATDRDNNWGNLVILHDDRGFHVELSHFAQRSIRVAVGDWVEPGTLLGLCGNSGYSPQPHIHVQVQSSEEVGAPTIPFSFVQYLTESRYHANDLPEEGSAVEALHPEKSLDLKMAFVLDEAFSYQVKRNGVKAEKVTLTVRMAPDGTFYFDSGRGRLYFGKHEGTFYHYRVDGDDPALRCLMTALPRLPLALREGMHWRDSIPVGLVTGRWRSALLLWLRSFHHALAQADVSLKARSGTLIEGSVVGKGATRVRLETTVELDDHRGLRRVVVGNVTLERLDDRTA